MAEATQVRILVTAACKMLTWQGVLFFISLLFYPVPIQIITSNFFFRSAKCVFSWRRRRRRRRTLDSPSSGVGEDKGCVVPEESLAKSSRKREVGDAVAARYRSQTLRNIFTKNKNYCSSKVCQRLPGGAVRLQVRLSKARIPRGVAEGGKRGAGKGKFQFGLLPPFCGHPADSHAGAERRRRQVDGRGSGI